MTNIWRRYYEVAVHKTRISPASDNGATDLSGMMSDYHSTLFTTEGELDELESESNFIQPEIFPDLDEEVPE